MLVVLAAATVALAACVRRPAPSPLVPAATTMVTAWEVPQDPSKDPSLTDPRLGEQIRWGYRIFTNTPQEAPKLTGARVSCINCHLNAGQRDRALPLVGVAGMFPEYNNRAARLISLQDRVVDCFLRSENGTAHDPSQHATTSSKEVLAVASYVTWLARGYPVGTNPSWRGKNTIPADKLIPVERIDVRNGEAIYTERCVSCHGADGQGVQIGDKKAGPLWGPDSWNDGAGAGRVYTLAGIVRYTMPYLNPGSLTDEEAQEVSAFINAKPRPRYPYKERDYVGSKVPIDAVYYRSIE
jgi:thiosulfate dehydrogenase